MGSPEEHDALSTIFSEDDGQEEALDPCFEQVQ